MATKALIQNIRDQLQARMQGKNFNTYSLEDSAALNRGAVCNIIYSKSKNPKIETLYAIANALGCKVDDLLQDKETLTILEEEEACKLVVPLFLDVVKATMTLLEKKQLSPDMRDTFFIIRKAYFYSLTKKNQTLDEEFLEWIVENNL